MIKHVPGDRIAVFQNDTDPGSLALAMVAELEAGVFSVEKSSRPTDYQPEEACRWMLEGPKAQIGPGPDRITGLLLAPSIVGIGLFGATQSPGSEVEGRFGAISLVQDRLDDSYLVNIEMPYPAVAGLGRLVINRQAILL